MKETFADRLKAAMEQRGLKQVDLIREAEQAGVKLGKSHMSQYVSGKTIPRSGVLHFLGCAMLLYPVFRPLLDRFPPLPGAVACFLLFWV